jgi:hypothetical protein
MCKLTSYILPSILLCFRMRIGSCILLKLLELEVIHELEVKHDCMTPPCCKLGNFEECFKLVPKTLSQNESILELWIPRALRSGTSQNPRFAILIDQ